MRSELTLILKNALAEQDCAGDDVILASVRAMTHLLLSTPGLLELVPEEIFGWEYPGSEPMPFPHNRKPIDDSELDLRFFRHRGILLHDGLYAAAHGGTAFTYRAKGQRLFLFENGDLMPINLYSTVNREGFFLRSNFLEEFSVNVRGNPHAESIRTTFNFVLNDPNFPRVRFIGQDIIELICNIKEPFKRAFLLEHLLIPPDVDVISTFSKTVRVALWDICLSKEFEAEVGLAKQNKCMNILSAAQVAPAPQQIVLYIKQLSYNNVGISEILDRLDQLGVSLGTQIEQLREELRSPDFWQPLFDALPQPVLENLPSFEKPLLELNDIKNIVSIIIQQFKRLVEMNGIWKELWTPQDKPHHESTAQRLFFLMAHSFCKAYDIDLSPEVDAGNGAVDFKLSSGYSKKVVVEIKLSTNTSLVHGYEKQLEIYKLADETLVGLFVIIDVGQLGNKLKKVEELKTSFLLEKGYASDIHYIDGRQKRSASKR